MANILIVDDEPSIRELFRYVFEEAGHAVALAGNGSEALELLQEELPEFILLDVAMPVMSGREFVGELARLGARDGRFRGIPFVVMTGENYLDKELNEVFTSAAGFVCFFPKMIPPDEVLRKAEGILLARG